MVRSSQFLRTSSILFGLALGSASFALAIHLDPSPAKAIPVSLPRKEKPAPKKSNKLASVSLAKPSVTTKKGGAALLGNTTSSGSSGK